MSAFVPAPPGPPAAGFSFWHRRSLRWQMMAAVIAINLGAALLALVVIIANARRATEVEMNASLVVAERFVEETVERLAGTQDAATSLKQLPLHVSGLRHVRIRIEDAQGNAVELVPSSGEGAGEEDEHEAEVPGWFAALVAVEGARRDIPVTENGLVIGNVRLVGEASDETAEVWNDTSDLALLALAVNIAVLGALYLVLGRLLMPLRTLSAGLSELEAGRFEHRLPLPKVRELAVIADRFNALGAALDSAREDNARLNEDIIHIQDEERRQIAADLHDELGPCLFGLRANLESIERLAGRTEPELGRRIGERAGTMADILDRVQDLNRRLLRKIRPMALGHVPLAALIADLLAEFERHSPGRTFALSADGLAERYGDSVDITVYRCIQEAVTNALRHGGARHIAVSLHVDLRAGRLHLVVEDDGLGVPAGAARGYGLLGIEERVGALGGSWRLVPARPSGTRVEMSVPLRGEAGARPAENRTTERTAAT
ncbi:ATP-binding protein [Ancylobacter sp. TS-1]|uniref:ATP-binding protein n=1 Tax=Ancylobacter sp. TS-1 TaxID=1850374 RepID=UPI001265D2BB|nr:ATP-binding protein [Ancylobacter sp. TS-1]QFR33753.1 histidine kinase [Ancylobacter sp. TS-1]